MIATVGFWGAFGKTVMFEVLTPATPSMMALVADSNNGDNGKSKSLEGAAPFLRSAHLNVCEGLAS